MRHILVKFILALLVFIGLVWFGLQRQQDEINHLADDAPALLHVGP